MNPSSLAEVQRHAYGVSTLADMLGHGLQALRQEALDDADDFHAAGRAAALQELLAVRAALKEHANEGLNSLLDTMSKASN